MKLITDAMAQTEKPAAAPADTAPAPAAPTPPAPGGSQPQPTQTGTAAPGAPDAAQPPSLPDLLAQLVPIFVVMGIVYIMVIRPRARREKAAADSLRNVRRGDTIVTAGGLIGKVTKSVDENEIELEIAANTRIRLLRTAILEVRSKGEPVKDTPAPAAPVAEKPPAKAATKSAQPKAKS